MQAGCLKIAPLSALLTSLKELSWSSSHEAQRWLDDGYQGESIPLSKQHLGVITPVTEKQEDLIFIIFLRGVSSSSWTNWFNTVKNWKGRVRYSGLWYCFNWWWETKERHHKDLNNQSQSFLQTTDTPEVDIRTKRDIPHSHYCICLLADLLGGVGGGDITTGHKAAKRLTAVGRFPAFFVATKAGYFFTGSQTISTHFCEQNQLLCTGQVKPSPAVFVGTKPDVFKETWGHFCGY